MASRRTTFLIIGGLALAFILVAILSVALLVISYRRGGPSIRDNSVLVLSVSGPLPDYVPYDPFRRVLGGTEQSLSSLVLQFRKAKVDERISAVLLEIRMSGAGWGKAEEIRDAIADFRSSGKPVYAYLEFGMNKEYYIASACDRVFLAPPGTLFVNGLAADVMFFRGSLDKLGIYPDIYQIGKYKSAGDTFTRKEMSEPHREAVNSLLDDLFNRYVDAVATARSKTADEVSGIIDNSPYTAPAAKEVGLIDEVGYRDDVENQLKARLEYKDTDQLRLVSAAQYRQVQPESLGLNKGEKIAVIFAMGDIGSGRSGSGPFGDTSIGSDTLVRTLKDAREDDSIKAIVLRVNSPGGSGLASDVIWNAVDAARQKKPVVISMSDVAASGGYYISASASKIVAQPSTITGSIGVVAGKPVVRGLYDWLGISNEYVLRGKHAGMFRETEKFTPEERAKFEEWINTTYYDNFVPKVARGRNRDVEYIDSVGQGRVWTGSQAKNNGLVDEFGGLDRAVEVAKELANIPADQSVRRVVLPHPRTLLQQLWGGGDDEAAQTRYKLAIFDELPEDARRALRYAALLDQMKNGELMLMMPFEIKIR